MTHARRLRALRTDVSHLSIYAGVMANAILPSPGLGYVWIVNKTRWPVAAWNATRQWTGKSAGGILLQ